MLWRIFTICAARVGVVVMLAMGCGIALCEEPARPQTAPVTRPATAASPTFAGQWNTSYGPMTLAQNGVRIEGTYGPGTAPNKINGTLEGVRFAFTYEEPGITGEGWFELGADGKSFSGKWREKGKEVWGLWRGTRLAEADRLDNFSGLWQTTYGKMRLKQTGNVVEGSYLFGGRADVRGTVEGSKLKFTYSQPDGEKGGGTFELAEGAKGFSGTWKSEKGMGGQWTATRVMPRAGRVWLVILEAPWEQDLEEEEYSYGAMLRSFFTRAPQVKVRHRFIHSESDLRKWCAEVPYLAEPVVLYISSHGTDQGITCGGKTIGPEVLAECLRDMTNIKLLHFGSCTVGGSPVPGKIHEALGASASFPISGFDRPVDWAASAIVDFTYMDLVLARGMQPAAAVDQTRKMVRFASAKSAPGDAIPATGLMLVQPGKK